LTLILPLYSTPVRAHLEYYFPLWRPQHRKGIDLTEQVQRRATKMIRGMEHWWYPYEERLTEMGSSLKNSSRKIVSWPFRTLKGAYKKDGERLFNRACSDRTRPKGFKLKEGRFRLDIRKRFFTMRVVKHQNTLPREVVDAPSRETFKVRLDGL